MPCATSIYDAIATMAIKIPGKVFTRLVYGIACSKQMFSKAIDDEENSMKMKKGKYNVFGFFP